MPIRLGSINLYAYLNSRQFLSLTGQVVTAGMAVATSSLIFRTLPIQEVGMWILFTSLLGLVDSIRAGFITTAFIRAYSGAAVARAAEVMGSTWLIALLITVLFVLLNTLALVLPIPIHDESLNVFFRWFSITFIITTPTFLAGVVLQAEMKFDKLLYLRILSQGLFILGIAVLTLTKQMSLVRLLYLNIGREAVASLASLLLGWTNVRMFRHWSATCAIELGHFGKYSIGSFIGSMLLRDTDTFIINFMLGPAALAVYNVAQRFLEFIEIPLRSSIAIAVPAMSAAFHQHDKLRLGWVLQKNAGVVTWVLVPIIALMLVFADVLVYLLAGSKYTGTEAANVLRIFLLIALLFPIDRYFGVALDVINQPKMNLFKVLIMLGTTVVGDMLGVKLLHNIYGVALATAPTIIAGFLFGYYAFSRYYKLSLLTIISTGLDETKRLVFHFLAQLQPAKS
ncbi:MAG: lipopolysaccharide biosynthesis protein [Hymenobacter sp.]|nr:MAG: lipopolysaccharide biosynthesis protein [Hymenobacter sp.]